jgi:deoxyxylulose-5-phosphate synthase
VLFAIDRGGVVGPDGATHAGNLDLSYLRCVPNMVVMAPADENECRQMLTTGFRHVGPAAVRYPRGTGPGVAVQPDARHAADRQGRRAPQGRAHRAARLRRSRAGGGEGSAKNSGSPSSTCAS